MGKKIKTKNMGIKNKKKRERNAQRFTVDLHSKTLSSFSFFLGHVCFPEFTFRKTIFQTFMCLFAIRKVGQRKTLSDQQKTLSRSRKTLSSQKNLVWFPEKCFPFWLCLFSGKWFPGNHFPNFPVFVCH